MIVYLIVYIINIDFRIKFSGINNIKRIITKKTNSFKTQSEMESLKEDLNIETNSKANNFDKYSVYTSNSAVSGQNKIVNIITKVNTQDYDLR